MMGPRAERAIGFRLEGSTTEGAWPPVMWNEKCVWGGGGGRAAHEGEISRRGGLARRGEGEEITEGWAWLADSSPFFFLLKLFTQIWTGGM
jgi:hypothetical protein